MNYFRALANLGATWWFFITPAKPPPLRITVALAISKPRWTWLIAWSRSSIAGRGIHRLTLRNFKGRFAPGSSHLGLEFVPKKGFVSREVPAVNRPRCRCKLSWRL